jgi:chloramphenicol-sensitive protein RarD
MGLLFYLNPGLQMAWGVLVGHEPMPVGRWIGFALIWVALIVLTVGSLRRKSEDPVPGSVDSVASRSSSRWQAR